MSRTKFSAWNERAPRTYKQRFDVFGHEWIRSNSDEMPSATVSESVFAGFHPSDDKVTKYDERCIIPFFNFHQKP